MNLINYTRLAICFIFLMPVFFSACVKDNCEKYQTYTYYVPVYKTKDEVRANIKSNPARAIEQPGKLYIRGNYIFLNEMDKGVHIIDNSNPSDPRNVAFIDIPGNLDIAVKDNTLFADLYSDLVAVDITNPASISVKKIVENIFPNRVYGGGFIYDSTNGIITEWVSRDTVVKLSCENNRFFIMSEQVFLASSGSPGGSNSAISPLGQGGSMARFTIMNNRLYTVSDKDLDVFDISTSNGPVRTNNLNVGWDIETIYPFKNKLFIGSMTGMYIYDVTNPDAPVQSGQFNHVRSCDPVIADDNYAYITLRSGTPCQGFNNELDIVRLNDFINPSLVKVYTLFNPHGLAKDGNYLFICDASAGVKVYNANDVNNLQLLNEIEGIDAYDIIAFNNKALVVAKNGLYQYDYSDINNIRLLSKLVVQND